MIGVTAALVIEYFHQLLKQMFDQEILSDIQALHLKDRVLTIACLNSSAANEIKFSEESIISAINEKFGENTVSSFKYML